jgi:hypothetical protein
MTRSEINFLSTRTVGVGAKTVCYVRLVDFRRGRCALVVQMRLHDERVAVFESALSGDDAMDSPMLVLDVAGAHSVIAGEEPSGFTMVDSDCSPGDFAPVAEATEYGRGSEAADSKKVNAAYRRLAAVLTRLRACSDKGESILVDLVRYSNGWVRLWAATDLLPLRPELASTALEELAAGPPGKVRFDAKMVLREWRAGRLKVPRGVRELRVRWTRHALGAS